VSAFLRLSLGVSPNNQMASIFLTGSTNYVGEFLTIHAIESWKVTLVMFLAAIESFRIRMKPT
jgi:hypothetical protein